MKIRIDALQKELGLKSRSELARWFGIRPQAIYQWGSYVPPLRAYRLIEAHPELYHLAKRGRRA